MVGRLKINLILAERSHSARITLEKAFELLPEEEDEEAEEGVAGAGGGPQPTNRNEEEPPNHQVNWLCKL